MHLFTNPNIVKFVINPCVEFISKTTWLSYVESNMIITTPMEACIIDTLHQK